MIEANESALTTFLKVVTDHRIGLTLYKLEQVLDGDLDEIIDALITHFQTERLKEVG